MTAGEEALREAARLETARVYGRLHREPVDKAVSNPARPVHDAPTRPAQRESPEQAGESRSVSYLDRRRRHAS